jgi:hypothetical protein
MRNKIIIFFLFYTAVSLSQTNPVVKLDSVADKGYYINERYPNPFSPVTYIDLNIPDSSNVIIYILNCSYIENKLTINEKDTIKIVYQGILGKRLYRVTWNLRDQNNNQIKNGCYAEYIKADRVPNIFQQMSFVGITKMIMLF